MAFYQILYWQDIPSQMKCWDDADEIKTELPPQFIARIDQVAQAQGLTSTDDYLAQWKWGEEMERPGTAAEVAAAVQKELEETLAAGGEE
jgi:hypothetical protein